MVTTIRVHPTKPNRTRNDAGDKQKGAMMRVPTKDVLRAEFEATRLTFHSLLASLTADDLRRRSHNPGWTNGELLFHMTLEFLSIPALGRLIRVLGRLPPRYSHALARLLNSFTSSFNRINALIPRLGGKVYTRKRLGALYDRIHRRIVRQLDTIPDNEWQLGMHYPTKWEPLFSDYMTLEEFFYYPIKHFNFHLRQLAR